MTHSTYRNYIKPMLFGITFVMVIFYCFMFAVMTVQGIWVRQFASCDGIINSPSSFNPYGIAGSKSFLLDPSVYSAFFALLIFQYCFYAILGFTILFLFKNKAEFTIRLKPIFASGMFAIFRGRFELFAFRALLCYDKFRHDCLLLINGLCLGPFAAHTSSGSFYITLMKKSNKNKVIYPERIRK